MSRRTPKAAVALRRESGAGGVEDFDAAFSTIKASGSEGLIVLVNPIYFLQRKQIIDRAADYRLPAIYEWKAFAQSGGLISYGAVSTDVYRRAASYADSRGTEEDRVGG